jgi:hypothetical protein
MLILFLVCGELIFYIPKGRAMRYDSGTVAPFIKFLQADRENFRVLGMNSILYPNSSSLYNIDCITNLDAMYPVRYMAFFKKFISSKIHDRFVGTELSPDLRKIGRYLSLMNVKYILATSHFNQLIPEILEKSIIIPENRWGVSLATFTLQGKTKNVLFQHPPSTLAYPLRIPVKPILRFSIAMSPDCWSSSKGDGVQFKIKIKEEDGIHEVFSRVIDPKNRVEDRKWFDYYLDLRGFANKNVKLILETDGINNNCYDWAGWGDIRLSSEADFQDFALVYDKEIKIFRNTNVLPRAFMVPEAIGAKNEEQALAILENAEIDLKKIAVLEEREEGVDFFSLKSGGTAWNGQAEIIGYHSIDVVINTTGSKEGFLVLTDLYYPGWKAYVDGNDEKILKANYLFRAIYLKGGEHLVKFKYDPWVFKIGWISFFLGVFSLGILFITKRK